jgi:hypothetical protein
MKNHRLLLAVMVAGFALAASAQTTAPPAAVPGPTVATVPPTAPEKPATINQRKTNQQDRIAQGLDSGQLTAGETRNLETQESDINKEERNMRQLDGGHLTAADKSAINQQQNQVSKQIYTDKHNAAQAAQPGTELNDRRVAQRDRIAQGIQSGQLTAGETARLENREVHTNQTARAMRAANGGKLTAADKQALNRQYNHTSNAIYRDKHNTAKR